MKTIITAAAILLSGLAANASTHEPLKMAKFSGSEISYEVFDTVYQRPIEDIILENNQITESDTVKPANANRAIEDIIREDIQITEAVIPAVQPLDAKKIGKSMPSKISSQKILVYGSL